MCGADEWSRRVQNDQQEWLLLGSVGEPQSSSDPLHPALFPAGMVATIAPVERAGQPELLGNPGELSLPGSNLQVILAMKGCS